MRKIDNRHIVFHVLVALYFLWMAVFGSLLGMALFNAYGNADAVLASLFTNWIFTNFIMGLILFLVIRLFRNRTLLDKIILYTYFFMAISAIVVVLLIE
ncbi:hypothetical protein R1T16_05815 [Flavobacterium sp. DG1-102-2]|uniref:hypothetical protein n=1 Tax=Flavobacterium sp. DG1-102-2 TaxID=3081663 RepID=UPI002948EE3E|nr:hypothetical protein [Flavobacterium sp. DG1-102-2]MDV6167932.1 hypothetical protein [Flavobacterium sp. DG1-102-2]